MKVLVIGLDGADPDFILKHKEDLPFISNMIDNGVFGKLRSTIPPLSATAWASLMTGKNPGKTGIIDFLHKGRVINSKNIKEPCIWDLLGLYKRKVGLVNIPLTYPPKRVNGFMITGMLTPSEEKEFTYPAEIKYELKNYKISESWRHYSDDKKFLKALYEITDIRIDNIKYLMNNKDWDFFMFVISETDSIQHFYLKPADHEKHKEGQEIILEYFKFLDKKLSEVADIDCNIFIMSDHGFGKVPLKRVNLNFWLNEKGLYSFSIEEKFKTRIKGKLVKIYTHPFMDKFRRYIPKKLLYKSKNLLQEERGDNIAFFTSSFLNTGFITINAKRKKKIISRVIRGLRNLHDPENKKRIIDEIYRREEIYSGRYIDDIPDIIFLFSELYYGDESSPTFIERVTHTKFLSGHRIDGIFIAHGPDIRKGYKIKNVEIIDLCPTILHMFGLPIPIDVDGKVLKEIFREDSKIIRKKIIYRDDYKKQLEKEMIRAKIKQLKMEKRI